MRWLADNYPTVIKHLLVLIPEYRRWDDLFIFVGTNLELNALNFIKHQLALDVQSETPSLLGKWMPSENTSSKKTRQLATRVRQYLNMTPREYRKMLSVLRTRINVLEKLMSEGRWDEIEFDKIPSKAGLKYKNAFAKHDIDRMKKDATVQSYADFAKDKNTTVNAKTLYPYEVVAKAVKTLDISSYYEKNLPLDDTDRLMVNKYWDNLEDYFNEQTFNGLAVVDTSSSMTWTRTKGAAVPLDVAISLGIYCAERAKGPFAGHYMSFSSNPRLVKVEGVDFCDKVARIYHEDLVDNTNIEKCFDLMLNTAIRNKCTQDEIPQNLIIISDMEFDSATTFRNSNKNGTLMEAIEKRWNQAGYKMPKLIFWNVNARNDHYPMKVKDGVSFVSGMSPTIFKQIMTGKTGYELMLEKLDSDRYAAIH